MFDTSLGLLIWSVITNIVVALLPGIFAMRLLIGTKWKGLLFYLLSWFLGVGVIANWMFDLQFIHFGIGLVEYAGLLVVLIVSFIIKLFITKQSWKDYISTLHINMPINEIKKSFTNLNIIEKSLTFIIVIFGLGFMTSSFTFTSHMPTYADDSFANWNQPIVHILHDGGVMLFGPRDQILARSRLGYPLHIPIYKTIISQFNGGYNDIYNNFFQYFTLLFGLIFIVAVSRKRTHNIFLSILPLGLICALPLVFIHSVEGYMELPSAIYSVLVIWLLYLFLIEKDVANIILAFVFGCILCYIKLDGLVVYLPGIVISFLIILYYQSKLSSTLKSLFLEKRNWLRLAFSAIFLFVPFQVIRLYHGLGLNPSDSSGTEKIGEIVHREIFSQFKYLFLHQDNYGFGLIVVGLMLYQAVRLYQIKKVNECYFILCAISIFIIITLVFLLTSNYQWVMNQTTVNRIYTMIFVILFSFIGISYHEHD